MNKVLLIVLSLISINIFINANKLTEAFRISNNSNDEISKSSNDDKRPFTVQDLHQLRKIGEVLMSPDKKYLVFQQTQWSFESKKTELVINSLNLENSKIEKLNISGNSPQFAKKVSNRLFYLSNDSKSVRSIEFPLKEDSKETIVEEFPLEIEGFKLSDNAEAYVFHCKIYFGDESDMTKTVAKDQDKTSRGSNTWEMYDKLFTNHWDVWNNHKIYNIFHQKLKKNEEGNYVKDSSAINIMSKMNSNSPIPPFGSTEMYSISPNGEQVTFTAVDTKGEEVNTNWRTYLVRKIGEEPKDIVTNEQQEKNFIGRTQNPQFSPDGTRVFFQAMLRPGLESDYLYLASYDIEKQTHVKHTVSWDYSVGDFLIYNNKCLFTVDFDGNTELFSITLDYTSEKIETLKQLTKFDNSPSSKLLPFGIIEKEENMLEAYLVETSDIFPNRISVMSINKSLEEESKSVIIKYEPNPEFHDKFYKVEQTRFQFKGYTLDSTQGWLLKPINFDPKMSYPVNLLIHGGPEGSLGNHWSYRWNALLWASQGYGVVMINPEGSTGKGQKFVDAVRNDWGGSPFETLMMGLDYILKENTWLNGDNACASGASFGGYMVNWIQGHTKRFKCLVTHDGVFSTLNMFYITDEMWFPKAEYCKLNNVGCTPFDSEEIKQGFIKFSPDRFIDNWSTPHLVIHGSMDLRIPISEGVSLFTALQYKGVPSKFVHFPLENHWVLNQSNSIGWYDNVLGWFNTYTTRPSPKK